jgi:tRNA (guanine-N7-)-methyltransferase
LARKQKLSLDILAPYLLPEVPRGEVGPPIVWHEMFGNDHPVEVEVGFGKGLFLNTEGAAHPERNFFGIEIVRKYQLVAATSLHGNGLANVRVACGDGNQILRDRVTPGSVDTVHVYFPDPWWKARHRKRRVFTPEFAHLCGRLLRTGGKLSIATDVELYFGIMKQIVSELAPAFRELPTPVASEGKDNADYLTHFERKFRKQGRPIYRAAYERTSEALPEKIAPDPGLSGPFVEFEPSE